MPIINFFMGNFAAAFVLVRVIFPGFDCSNISVQNQFTVQIDITGFPSEPSILSTVDNC